MHFLERNVSLRQTADDRKEAAKRSTLLFARTLMKNRPTSRVPQPSARPRQAGPRDRNPQYGYPYQTAQRGRNQQHLPPSGVRRPVKRKKKKAKRVGLAILFSLLAIICVLLIAGYFIKEHLLNQVQYVTDASNPTMINEDGSVVSLSDVATQTTNIEIPKFDYIHNILLIGIDSRDNSYASDGTGSRSDIMMILTIDEHSNTIKLTSIQRDCYADIPGYTKPQKINAAMAYGGPQLLMLVLQNELRMNIDQYAYVNFYHMSKIIDEVGGVRVNVSEEEKSFMPGQYDTGDCILDGDMAVVYARIRHLGNGDYDRSKRQVEILQSLLNSYMKMSLVKKTTVLDDVLGEIVTNMTKTDIENYAFTLIPKLTSPKIDYLQVPIDGYYNEGMYSDVTANEWSIRANWNGMIPLIQQHIFGQTYAFDPVNSIPGAPTVTPTPTPGEDPTGTGGA